MLCDFVFQAQEAGLGPPPETFDNADDKLRSQQHLQQLMHAQEEASGAKTSTEESNQLTESQLDRMQGAVSEQLENLIQQDLLTPEQKNAILSEHNENEARLRQKMDAQRERLKAKLATHRGHRLSQLREQQEKEKNAVSTS
jgi:hypothetical protein